MERPRNLPTCEHGKIAGQGCTPCAIDRADIMLEVKPLVDEFWENKGVRDLGHLMYRAYRKGRESRTPSPSADKLIAALDEHIADLSKCVHVCLDSGLIKTAQEIRVAITELKEELAAYQKEQEL